MVNYLLLRDNKETGPFSLEDLLKMGLKAYDLVWIPGKSAAWRYPCEIDELKPYAPEVEEQPFDRFFKKPATTQQTEAVPSPVPQAEIPAAHQAYAPKVAVEQQQKYVAKKSVFVTLPNQLAEKKTAAMPKPAPVPKPTPTPIPDYTATDLNETISITENPVAKIKYSQPLDEIKEMYVKTLRERKERIARKSFLKVNLKRAAVVSGLIGIGVLAGFILQSKPASDSHLAQKPSSVASTVLAEHTPPAGLEPATDSVSEQSAAVTSESPLQQKQEPIHQPQTSSPAPSMNNEDLPAEKEVIVPPSKAKAIMPAPQLKEEPVIAQQDYMAADKDPVSGERTRAVRSSEQKENPERKTASVTPDRSSSPERMLPGWGNQVTVSSNDYKRVALGGIRNLELTVTNHSKYNLDQVTVELQYIKPNEQPVKTEMIQFKSISSNESATVRVPDTNRGIRVEFKIVRIGSRQANDLAVGNR
ncbi:MAG: hypothetical protein ACTHMV_04580 [Chitinophagaceae bacterium]